MDWEHFWRILPQVIAESDPTLLYIAYGLSCLYVALLYLEKIMKEKDADYVTWNPFAPKD